MKNFAWKSDLWYQAGEFILSVNRVKTQYQSFQFWRGDAQIIQIAAYSVTFVISPGMLR